MSEPNLQLSITKLTVRHIAEHSTVADAESLLRSLRETVTYLERRIAREKLLVAKKHTISVLSVTDTASVLTT